MWHVIHINDGGPPPPPTSRGSLKLAGAGRTMHAMCPGFAENARHMSAATVTSQLHNIKLWKVYCKLDTMV
jgi:hypothetical protein